MRRQGEGNSSKCYLFLCIIWQRQISILCLFEIPKNAIIFNLCFSDYNSLYFIRVYFAIREVSCNVPYTILMKYWFYINSFSLRTTWSSCLILGFLLLIDQENPGYLLLNFASLQIMLKQKFYLMEIFCLSFPC